MKPENVLLADERRVRCGLRPCPGYLVLRRRPPGAGTGGVPSARWRTSSRAVTRHRRATGRTSTPGDPAVRDADRQAPHGGDTRGLSGGLPARPQRLPPPSNPRPRDNRGRSTSSSPMRPAVTRTCDRKMPARCSTRSGPSSASSTIRSTSMRTTATTTPPWCRWPNPLPDMMSTAARSLRRRLLLVLPRRNGGEAGGRSPARGPHAGTRRRQRRWYLGAGRGVSRGALPADAVTRRRGGEGSEGGFSVGFAPEAFSETAPAGSVLEQTPEPSQRIRKGGRIELVLSAGPERYNVPNLVDMSLADATAALAKLNLVVGEVTPEYDDKIALDAVISNPAEGRRLSRHPGQAPRQPGSRTGRGAEPRRADDRRSARRDG